MKIIMLLTFIILVSYPYPAICANYANYMLVDIEPTSKDHLDFFSFLDRNKGISVIFLKNPTRLHQSVQFITETVNEEVLMERMRHYGIMNAFVNKDLHGASLKQSFKKYLNGTDEFDFENFHNYDDISRWFQDLTRLYPNIAELKHFGNSSLGKPIYSLNINHHREKSLPKVFIEAGVHGNEWLPIAFVTYLVDALLNLKHISERNFRKIAENIDWYLVPVVNPDGFEYSFKTDRFWKKNRRNIRNSTAIGVNLDRNFGYNWGEYGSSKIPSNENFAGRTAFSEPETRALAYYVNGLSRNLLCYFSFHSYGQNIIIPHGDAVNHDENYMHRHNIAEKAASAIRRIYGTKYLVGTNYDTNGMRISGNSASWIRHQYNTQCVYTFQMQDTGKLGYFMPSKSIIPASNEMITALTTILDHVPKPRVRYDLLDSSSPKCASQVLVLLYFMCVVMFLLK